MEDHSVESCRHRVVHDAPRRRLPAGQVTADPSQPRELTGGDQRATRVPRFPEQLDRLAAGRLGLLDFAGAPAGEIGQPQLGRTAPDRISAPGEDGVNRPHGLDAQDSVEVGVVGPLAGAKVVMVGDDRQLGAVGPGGALRALLERHRPAVHILKDNIRQEDPNERRALAHLLAGNVQKAVAWYADEGRIVTATTRNEALDAIVNAWAAATPPETASSPWPPAPTAG